MCTEQKISRLGPVCQHAVIENHVHKSVQSETLSFSSTTYQSKRLDFAYSAFEPGLGPSELNRKYPPLAQGTLVDIKCCYRCWDILAVYSRVSPYVQRNEDPYAT
jgi:hypothetical protein